MIARDLVYLVLSILIAISSATILYVSLSPRAHRAPELTAAEVSQIPRKIDISKRYDLTIRSRSGGYAIYRYCRILGATEDVLLPGTSDGYRAGERWLSVELPDRRLAYISPNDLLIIESSQGAGLVGSEVLKIAIASIGVMIGAILIYASARRIWKKQDLFEEHETESRNRYNDVQKRLDTYRTAGADADSSIRLIGAWLEAQLKLEDFLVRHRAAEHAKATLWIPTIVSSGVVSGLVSLLVSLLSH